MAAGSLPETYGQVQYNPLCVLLHEDSTALPNDWQNVSEKQCRRVLLSKCPRSIAKRGIPGQGHSYSQDVCVVGGQREGGNEMTVAYTGGFFLWN